MGVFRQAVVTMRKRHSFGSVALCILVSSLASNVLAHEPLESDVQGWLNGEFADALSSGDVAQVQRLLAPDARAGLSEELHAKASEPIDFRYRVESVTPVSEHVIRVEGDFEADTINWRVSGFSAFFVLEEKDDGWLVQDTNVFQKFGFEQVGRVFAYIAIPLGVVLVLFSAFWLWMLIDCIRRDFDDKVVWLMVLVLTTFLGAVIYFFAVKLRAGKRAKSRKRSR
jgi:hypothetical protein